jgi:2-polyprenyl-3-methyl-5-hydroxy-6-metoxy-1,4-benzoquinol methylase
MADYYLGHSQLELDRLMAEAVVLRPITERLLLKAGLRPGMRVLDIGCGIGDVSLLAAERVGSSGFVVGIDIAEKAVTLARHRAEEFGFENMAFHLAGDTDGTEIEPFDFVIGRYIVLHQADPVEFIRAAAARARPGGIVAFHEVDLLSNFATRPAVPHFDAIAAEIVAAAKAGVPTPDAAGRLIALFVAAGLPVPKLFCERPAGGDQDSPLYHALATNFAAIRALTHPAEPPIWTEAVEAALRDAVAAVHGQIVGPDQVCAWARL